MPNWIAKLIGKFASKKLNLQEGTVETKKWYTSKTVWVGIVTGVLGIYMSIPGLPPIPEWVFAILGGMGIYTRVTATTKIG